ncbi:unnamed protein product, partial [Ectocarpus sp. 12 AP-2014]
WGRRVETTASTQMCPMRWRERASSLWRRILSQAVARRSAFCSPWGRRASAACTSSTRSRRGT